MVTIIHHLAVHLGRKKPRAWLEEHNIACTGEEQTFFKRQFRQFTKLKHPTND